MKRLLSTSLLAAALLPLSAMAATYSFTANTSPLIDMPHGTAVTWGLTGTSYTSLFNDVHANKAVTSATLTLTNIYDWTGEATDPCDALFINILSGLNTGLTSKAFSSGSAPSSSWSLAVNPFVNNTATTGDFNDILKAGTALPFTDATTNSLLKANAADSAAGTPSTVSWSDGSGTVASTVVITFTGANLAVLQSLINADSSSTLAPTVGLGFAAECHYYMSSATLSVTTAATVPDSGNTLALMGLGLAALAGFRRSKK